MAFQRPSLSDLISRIQQDFIARLGLGGAVLRRSLVYIFSRVFAGAVYLLYGFIAWAVKQVFPDQSDDDYMLRQAALFGITPNPATFATRNVVFTGTSGVTVPSGTVLVHFDGMTFTTNTDAVLAGGTATVLATAALAGIDGNVSLSDTLDFEAPIAGVNSSATMTTGGVDGSDQETNAACRARFIARLQNPPQGGAASDYEAWALQVSGVTRAWVDPLELGAGTVVVRFVRDNDAGGPIPTAGEVSAVQSYINNLRPVTAAVTVLAPIADVTNFSIHLVPSNSTTQAEVTAALGDLFTRLASPGGTIPLSQIELAIGNAAGVTDFTTTATAITSATGHLPTLGVITFT